MRSFVVHLIVMHCLIMSHAEIKKYAHNCIKRSPWSQQPWILPSQSSTHHISTSFGWCSARNIPGILFHVCRSLSPLISQCIFCFDCYLLTYFQHDGLTHRAKHDAPESNSTEFRFLAEKLLGTDDVTIIHRSLSFRCSNRARIVPFLCMSFFRLYLFGCWHLYLLLLFGLSLISPFCKLICSDIMQMMNTLFISVIWYVLIPRNQRCSFKDVSRQKLSQAQ